MIPPDRVLAKPTGKERTGMLIRDYLRHNPWMLCTIPLGAVAILAYLWCDRQARDGLTGASTLSLWYGVLGTACLIWVGLMLAWQRREKALSGRGRVRSWWLKGHVWLSLLAAVLILCHSGGRLGGRLETVLMAAFGLTLLTGFLGLGLQAWLTRWLTRSAPGEVPLGQVSQVCQVWRHKADALVEQMRGRLDAPAAAEVQTLYQQQVRPWLYGDCPKWRVVADRWSRVREAFDRVFGEVGRQAMAKELTQLQEIVAARGQLARQQWLHGWLHRWLLVHVALSVALLVLAAIHAWASLYY